MLALSAPAARAAEPQLASAKHLQIPVFFLCDRNVEPAKTKGHDVEFGDLRQHLARCPHDPNMGGIRFDIDNFRGFELTPKLKEAGWSGTADGKEGEYTLSLINEPDFAKRETKFYNAILAAALKDPDKEIDIFVPGYMSTIRSGAESAARIGYYSKHPVVLYSWPSKGKMKAYSSDEASVEWSQPHFNRMLQKLTALCAENDLHMRLYSHSMGNRLVLRAVPLMRENHYLTEVAMICPDLDDGITLHYLGDYASAKGTTRGRLYMSRKDRMLVLSQLVHGGYLRFGEQPEASGLLPMAPGAGTELAQQRFQSIDFTAIDEGVVGHKIPVALLCAMSATNGPPKGLKLLETSKFNETHAAKFLSDAQHVPESQSEGRDKHYKVQIDEGDKSQLKYYKRHKFVWQTIKRKDWSLK